MIDQDKERQEIDALVKAAEFGDRAALLCVVIIIIIPGLCWWLL